MGLLYPKETQLYQLSMLSWTSTWKWRLENLPITLVMTTNIKFVANFITL